MNDRSPCFLLSSLSVIALSVVLGCGGDDEGLASRMPDAAPPQDSAADAAIDPGALPIGGIFDLVVYDTQRYGFAALLSDVIEVEGAEDPTALSLPATADEFILIPTDPGQTPPQHELTVLDAGPNLFSSFGEETFTYAQDRKTREYVLDFLTDQPMIDAPSAASFVIPAVGDVKEASYSEIIEIQPMTLMAPGLTSIPDPAAPIDLSWSGVPDDAALSFTVAAFVDGNFLLLCDGAVVNDGSFVVPAECVVPDAQFFSILAFADRDLHVDYNGRRVRLQGRYQTQVDLAPAPDKSSLLRRQAHSCLADASAHAKSQVDFIKALRAEGAKCAAAYRNRDIER